MVRDITDAEFKDATASGLVLVDFWATWCGPCKMQAPVIDQIAEEMSNVEVFKEDVDENKETAQEFGIMSIPTLLVKKDGEVVDKLTGYHSKDQLVDILNSHK